MDEQLAEHQVLACRIDALQQQLHALVRHAEAIVPYSNQTSALYQALAEATLQLSRLSSLDGSPSPHNCESTHISEATERHPPFPDLLSDRTQLGQTILSSITQGIIVYDRQFCCRLWNSFMEQMLGIPANEVLGKTLQDRFPFLYDETGEEILNRVLAGETIHAADRAFHLPETQKAGWLGLQFNPLRDAANTIVGMLVIVSDTTGRKHLEDRLRQWAKREQALNRVIQMIREPLELNTIFSRATQEISSLLQVDQVMIFQRLPLQERWQGMADYRRKPGLRSILGVEIRDCHSPMAEQLQQGNTYALTDVDAVDHNEICAFLKRYSGAWLMIPLWVDDGLWGILGLRHAGRPYLWQSTEIELGSILANQLAIAIQRSELYAQVQHLNINLERQVRARTAELQLAYDFEATLKRITDRVRDSLDEHQILQTAVQELALGMGVLCCNAALFDLERDISTICYEYTTELAPSKGRVSSMSAFPEIYAPLMRGEYFQFCSTLYHPQRDRVAMLVCPIRDDQGVMGDLWLISPSFHAFNHQDIRLVQQVANQCAIALRQARLYEAAQAQVQELARLNQLKDDFLSTVSHELRTPMSNIKIATQMLEMAFEQLQTSTQLPAIRLDIKRYLRILRDEGQREITLINDLLDLSRLDADVEPLWLTSLQLSDWIPAIAEVFGDRLQSRQQQLHLVVPPVLPLLTTDLSYLERILSELLTNASKYTPSQGDITIAAHALPSGIEIRISNTGSEVPATERDRIFEKFYRIPSSDPWKHEGTGLGLALVKKMVEQLQGRIWVESSPGETTFVVQLPQQASPTEGDRPPHPSS
ncbi:ATP-binding protein [Leptolyngbya sp. AN02str]|uniref:sensor histidine kinase n=1 Tax=Leptolyngbya sp. AN02str TaxID=3423363 RepID=UPI003D31F401